MGSERTAAPQNENMVSQPVGGPLLKSAPAGFVIAANGSFPPFLRYVFLLRGHQFDRREWLARAVCFVWRGRQVRGRQNVGGNRGFDWSVAGENDYNRACWESFMSTPCQRAYVFFRRVLRVKTRQCCSMSDVKFC